MADDLTFRSEAVKEPDHTEKVTPVKSPAAVPSDTTETPVALYRELKGHPYSAEYFDVKGIWDNPDLSLKDDLLTIEEGYRQKVQDGLQDGKKTYEGFIKEAEKATGATGATSTIKIAKIAEWIRFMQNIKKIDRTARTYGH